MVTQPTFGGSSCRLSHNGKELYLVAIAPAETTVKYVIYNDKANTLLAQGNLQPGANGAKHLFNTRNSLYYETLTIDSLGLKPNTNYNVVIHYLNTDEVDVLTQYNFVFKPNLVDQYADALDLFKTCYIGNTMIEFHKATEDNVTRNVSIGDLDHIVYKTKYDNAEDWTNPISTQTQYVWYFEDGKVEYKKESD